MIKLTINSIGRPDDPMYDLDWYFDELRDYLESQGSIIPEYGFFLTLAELEQLARDAFEAGRLNEGICGKEIAFSVKDFKQYWQQKKKLLEKNVNEENEG